MGAKMEDIQIKNRILILKRKLKKNETYKVSKSDKFYSISIFKKPQIVKGMASYCDSGQHVLFIDFDNVPEWLVKQDYARIQKEYNLPPGYLFATKQEKWQGENVGNFHIICLKKFKPADIYQILTETHADTNYMSMPLRRVYRNWVLRISTKKHKSNPKFLQIIGDDINLDYEVSSAHLKFLKKIYPIPDIKYKNLDKGGKIYLQQYETS